MDEVATAGLYAVRLKRISVQKFSNLFMLALNLQIYMAHLEDLSKSGNEYSALGRGSFEEGEIEFNCTRA